MSDNAIENAEAAKAKILNRLLELEAEKRMLEKQLSEAQSFLTAAERYARLQPGELPIAEVPSRYREANSSQHRNPRREDVVEKAIEIIEREGRPVRLRAIYDHIVAEGMRLTGTDPVAVLGTMLWRAGREGSLVNLKGHGYWPARLSYEKAGYEPRRDSGESAGN